VKLKKNVKTLGLKVQRKVKSNFEFLQGRKGIMLNFDELDNGQNSS